MRVLFHAVNGTGLGHLHRQVNLALSCRARGLEVLIYTSARRTDYPRHFGIPVVSIPPGRDESLFGMESLQSAVDPLVSGSLLDALLTSYEPNVLVFDTFVSRQRLISLRSKYPRIHIVLVLRQDKNALVDLQNKEKASLLDMILVVHERDDALREHPSLASLLESQLRFIGPVTRPATHINTKLDPVLGIQSDHSVATVTLGAGGHPQAQETFRKILAAMTGAYVVSDKRRIVCLTGPYADHSALPQNNTVIYVKHLVSPLALFARSDIVIAHAGYNTVHEVLSVRTRALFLSQTLNSESQLANLPGAARHVITLDSSSIDSAHLHTSIMRRLALPPHEPHNFLGGEQFADALIKTFSKFGIAPQKSKIATTKIRIIGHNQLWVHDTPAPHEFWTIVQELLPKRRPGESAIVHVAPEFAMKLVDYCSAMPLEVRNICLVAHARSTEEAEALLKHQQNEFLQPGRIALDVTLRRSYLGVKPPYLN